MAVVSKHRLGVSVNYLVKRKLLLDPVSTMRMQTAMQEIDAIYGMDHVSFVDTKRQLNLAYDGSRVGIDQIETILAAHGVVLARSWWLNRRLSKYRFIDQNIKDNRRQEPWCCH